MKMYRLFRSFFTVEIRLGKLLQSICAFTYGYHSHTYYTNTKFLNRHCSSTSRRVYSVTFSVRRPSFQCQFSHFVLRENLGDIHSFPAHLSFNRGWNGHGWGHLNIANDQALAHLALHAIDAV